MLALGQGGPSPYGDIQAQTANTRTRELGNETALLKLAELKRSQASEEMVMAAIQKDPDLARLFFGESAMGQLGQAPGGPPAAAPPSAGPLTQQTTMPGQPPQAPQMVPGGQDLSRNAGVSPQGGGPIPPDVMAQTMPQVTPPQGQPGMPVLSTLGGQPQGPMQTPRNPVLEMARTNPRAAMMLQQQMQGQQDRQTKMQEQQLSMGVKVMEYIARGAQAVKSQEGLEALRQDIARVHPQAAASLPQMYSKEAMEPFITRGTAAADRAKNQLDEAKARNLDMETRMFPELAKRFGMESDAQVPADGGATTTAAPTTGTQARTAPPEFESAITEANRLYPQVSTTRIKSIIAAESNFDPKAVSSAGAKGPMQLMPGTAKDMGVDDPFNVPQNVRGGTRYYAQMLNKYGGDERKALTAYNWGPGNLDKVDGDVSKAPPETQAYVNRVLGGGGAGPAGGATGTAQAPADPRIAGLETKIAQRTRDAQIASLMKNESLSTRLNDDANRLTAEKNRLETERTRIAERTEERVTDIPRAVEKERALGQTKQDLERQRQGQPMLPEDRRKFFTGLRTDILKEPTFKIYQDVRNGYQNVKVGAASDSAQGDLAIFNGLAKILDPTSSVMSGEAKNIEEAQGQLQMWFNSPQKFLEGDRISKENRPRFLKMAYDLAREKLTTAQTELKTVYGPLAKEGNIDFDQLVPLSDLKPLEPGPNVSKFEKLVAP